MSAYQTFDNLPAALADFAAGLCRRHVRIDGHVIDLVQAKAPCAPSRPGADEPRGYLTGSLSLVFVTSLGRVVPISDPPDREAHDRAVVENIAAELARAAAPVELPPLAEPVLPAPPPDASAYRCPWCSRPWDGVK